MSGDAARRPTISTLPRRSSARLKTGARSSSVLSVASACRVTKIRSPARAQNIARAGERIFVTRQALATDNTDEDRAPVFNLALDLLGNVEMVGRLAASPDMHEWDQLRMLSGDGLKAGAAVGVELSRVGLANGRTLSQFAGDFAAATSHRAPYLFALVHGAAGSGPYALGVSGASTSTSMSLTSDDAAAVRKLPFGDL